mmetsp:Transcript_10407/g.29650  ORF Transcript_10407/g.29650 Transcript_10407/m.29650 type:complete len:130 (+) Transcript_10407:185-574(+)
MSDSLFDQPAMARPYAASANAVDHSLEQFSNTDCDCRDRRTSSTSICSAYSTAPSDFYEARCIVSSAGSLDHLCNSLDGIDMRSFNPKLLRKNRVGRVLNLSGRRRVVITSPLQLRSLGVSKLGKDARR